MCSWVLFLILSFSRAEAQQIVVQVDSQIRRNYPGGKDDSDLTVQNLRKITRKGEDIDAKYQGHGEPLEDAAEPPIGQGFGE